MATGEIVHLSRDRTGESLTVSPDEVARLLDSDRFRALLPPETGAAGARNDHGRIGFIADWLPLAGLWFGAIGVLLLPVAAYRLGRLPVSPGDGILLASRTGIVPLPRRTVAIACSAAAAGSLTLLIAWPQSLEFNEARRWTDAFAPARVGVSFFEPSFSQQGYGPHVQQRQTVGAVETLRPVTVVHWHGSRIGGTEFTGILASQEFEVGNRFFSTPVTGWPSWPGNGLRWRFRNPSNGDIEWLSYDSPNPQLGIAVWTIDASQFAGWNASLFIFDGRTDAEGWLGAGRPALSDDPDFGPLWAVNLRAERAEPTHKVLASVTAGSLIATLLALLSLAHQSDRNDPGVARSFSTRFGPRRHH